MDAVSDKTEIRRIVHDRPEQLEGFTVVATDGQAGKVAGRQEEVDDYHFVVHIGKKMLGHDVVLEIDVISLIDPKAQEVHVDRITDWVKSSPRLKHHAQ